MKGFYKNAHLGWLEYYQQKIDQGFHADDALNITVEIYDLNSHEAKKVIHAVD